MRVGAGTGAVGVRKNKGGGRPREVRVWWLTRQWQDVLDLARGLGGEAGWELYERLDCYDLWLPPVARERAYALWLGVDAAEWDRRWALAYAVSERQQGKADRDVK